MEGAGRSEATGVPQGASAWRPKRLLLRFKKLFQYSFLFVSGKSSSHRSQNGFVLIVFRGKDAAPFLAVDERKEVDAPRIGHFEPNQV